MVDCEKPEAVQVATLLTVVWEEMSTFTGWEHAGDEAKIAPVLTSTASLAETFRSKGIVSTVGRRRRGKQTALRKIVRDLTLQKTDP